ncbi:hypothetical protein [Lentilactobacillus hilgardii]|uniref:hypothetical protein n=1 Tax=Lentilactobacillus hilgardii TaxID=1588 RepID=UPI0021A290D7|nr:hypothetical protein [Lentilactobacillus hilgardii]MCT3396341.1 hypothetical protein [Lentilactobacillus hilgardii]
MEKDKSSKLKKAAKLEVSQIFVPYINFDLENLDRKASQASLKIESKLIMNANKDDLFADAKFETNFALRSEKDVSPYFQATIDVMLLVKSDHSNNSEINIEQLKEAIDSKEQLSTLLKSTTSNMLISVFSDCMFKATGRPVTLSKQQIEANMLH